MQNTSNVGLGGVNCRHRMFAFIPGVSKPNPIKYGDTAENRRIYEATQKQRKYEREIRSLKKQIAAVECVKGNDDDNTLQNLKLRLKHKQSQLQEHCNANGLKRNYSRELVQEQTIKTKTSKFYNNSSDSKNPITENSINNIHQINISNFSEKQNIVIHKSRKDLLTTMMKEKVGTEGQITILLKQNKVLPVVIGEEGKVFIDDQKEFYYSLHNHPDNDILSISDIINFLNRPNMIGIESISNNGLCISSLTKSIASDSIGYENFIRNTYRKYQNLYNDFSKIDRMILSNISKEILEVAGDYGFIYQK